jgi:hypothetical protein
MVTTGRGHVIRKPYGKQRKIISELAFSGTLDRKVGK